VGSSRGGICAGFVFGLADIVEGIPDCHSVTELIHQILVGAWQWISTLLFRTRPTFPFDSKLFRGGNEYEVREFSATQHEIGTGLPTAGCDLTIQEPLQRRSCVPFFRDCPKAAVAQPFSVNLVIRPVKRIEYRDK